MSTTYNEIEPYAAQWIRNLAAAGHVAPGEVIERSITEVQPDELGSGQVHLFAGVAVWSHALRMAGYPDEFPVWSASCPCQPFSSAGRGKGTDDARHLWPDAFRLVRQRRPACLVGEQVASPDGLAWLDAVHADMEGEGYAFAAFDLCAAGFGAPHIRQRLYFAAVRLDAQGGLAHHHQQRFGVVGGVVSEDGDAQPGAHTDRRGATRGLGHADGEHPRGDARAGAGSEGGPRLRAVSDEPRASGADGRLVDSVDSGLEGHAGDGNARSESRRVDSDAARSVAAPGPTNGHWAGVEWLPCRDGKWRPTQPGLFPLAHGATERVGRLKAYGNAIVAPQAQGFLEALKPSVAHLFGRSA